MGLGMASMESTKNYPWKNNPEKDDSILWELDFIKLSEQIFYLQNSWLLQQKNVRILVTGASNWLGHNILYVLTQNLGIADILAVDYLNSPKYLSSKRYQDVRYTMLQRRQKDLGEIILSFRPHLIFHTDYIWQNTPENLLELYQVNLGETETICKISSISEVKRIIMFSDFSIYGMGNELAEEDVSLSPIQKQGQSFKDAEAIAEKYHSETLQIYHLRAAPLFGRKVSIGIMLLAKMIYDGLLLGYPHQISPQISLVHEYDLALAAFLLALAPKPGHRIFNVSSNPLNLRKILQIISNITPKKNILGISSNFAHIMKIGYQEQIEIPTDFLKLIGRFSYHTTNFLNQMRWHHSEALVTEKTIEYILQLRALSNKRMLHSLGWIPNFSEEQLISSIEYACQNIWNQPVSSVSSELSQHQILLDISREISDAVIQYSPDKQEQLQTFKIPMSSILKKECSPIEQLNIFPLFTDIEIDIKTLWILLNRAWNFFITLMLRGQKNINSTGQVFGYWEKIAEKVLLLMRYEHDRSQKMFSTTQERLSWLAQQIGAINYRRLQRYISIVLLEEIFLQIESAIKKYGAITQLLPDKNFGLFLANEVGDIAIIFKVTDGKITIEFPRQELDSLLRSWYFPKRLLEFQKIAKLHIVLGARLERFFSDLISGNFVKNFEKNFGKEYVLSDASQHYQMIGEAVKKTKINTYIFLNQENKATFGIQVKDKKFSMVSYEYLNMLNTVIDSHKDNTEIIQMISQSTQGQEELALFKIQTVRKLLAGVIAPSRFKKIIIKLLQRAAGW